MCAALHSCRGLAPLPFSFSSGVFIAGPLTKVERAESQFQLQILKISGRSPFASGKIHVTPLRWRADKLSGNYLLLWRHLQWSWDSICHNLHACVYSLSKLFLRFSVLMCSFLHHVPAPDDDLVRTTPPTMCLSERSSQRRTVMKGARHIKTTSLVLELRSFTGRMSQNNIFTAWLFNVARVGGGGRHSYIKHFSGHNNYPK